jgi:hypothetical protein
MGGAACWVLFYLRVDSTYSNRSPIAPLYCFQRCPDSTEPLHSGDSCVFASAELAKSAYNSTAYGASHEEAFGPEPNAWFDRD